MNDKTPSSKVELIESLGSDLTVVNSARVSFAKNVTEFKKSDEKLISFLARNNHWTPFAHCFLQFRIKAPIFVARQLVKHQVGLVWNEVSRRYVNSEPELFMPTIWRSNPENKKQGSSDVPVKLPEDILWKINTLYIECGNLYFNLLKLGVCAEQARMVLPLSMMTEWYWSGSLYAFSRVCNLRCAKDSQKETQEVALEISKQAEKVFPISWKYLIQGREN